jgi:hypothetical protein
LLLELLRIPLKDIGRIETGTLRVEAQIRFFTYRGCLFIGAGEQAGIAAEQTRADFLFQPGKIVGILGQVTDASIGKEESVRAQSPGRAGAKAKVAVLASGGLDRPVRGKVQCRNQLSKKELASECGMDKHVIFSDEAQPGPLSEGSFGQRGRIDSGLITPLKIGRQPALDKLSQPKQAFFNKWMIIVV